MAVAPAELSQLAPRTTPTVLAGERRLPVLPALEALLPDGLQRGTTVAVDGGPGATALVLAVAAGPSIAGSWVAALAMPALGLATAGELGIALERLLVVPSGEARVVAAMVDAVDVVLLGRALNPQDARRLAARTRERGAVVLVPGGRWPLAPDVRLTVSSPAWDIPHERLASRTLVVTTSGRGAASRPRRADLVFPTVLGAVAPGFQALPHRVQPMKAA
jgi:hypothetical protein